MLPVRFQSAADRSCLIGQGRAGVEVIVLSSKGNEIRDLVSEGRRLLLLGF